ncbi:MAG: XRE family transcriptional regulator [Firmicutes bacterium]|nr:XRE family transcriptional regulator [Bacillota bacterium]
MKTGQRIKKIRATKRLSTNDLSKLTGISQSAISKLENGKRRADIETLEKIAAALNVSTDRLIGESASSIINDRLVELNVTLPELSEEAHVPVQWLQNLDTFSPDAWTGDNDMPYKWITQVAEALGLSGSILRAALARQETPVYDGPKEMLANSETRSIGRFIKVPIIGTVMAGPNGLAYEDYQGEEIVDSSLVSGDHLFYLRIKGDSMIGDGILPGDLALVRETPEVEYGALAIVLVNGEEGTIKRVYYDDDSLTLIASNPTVPAKTFTKEEMNNVRIVGEVKMTLRSY